VIGIPQRFRSCIRNAELPHPHKDMHDDISDDDPYRRGRQDPGVIATRDPPCPMHTPNGRDNDRRTVEPRFEAFERDGGR
jgi:geranylgeranyl pyrophosphate synthase